jgi:Flp pilus assembly protein TadD
MFVIFTYLDARHNVFHLDDRRNIFRYPPVMMTEFSVERILDAGREALLPTRPLPSMTFAINWWQGGGSPRPFQVTNILIHGLTAIVVFSFLITVLGRLNYSRRAVTFAALVGAAVWACHPIQVQAVTYIVQRMTMMAALFSLLAVLAFLLGRETAHSGKRWTYYLVGGICWLFGLASKETAAIVPFLVLLAEYAILRQGRHLIRDKRDYALLSIPVVITALIFLDIASGAGPLSRTFQPGFEGRDFTMVERLLTQPRVIMFHLSQIIWPVPGRFSLEHDFVLSEGLMSPPETFAALVGIVGWCSLGIWTFLKTNTRVAGFFMLWIPATLVIESTIVPLEMVFEHRMYLPSVGLVGLAALGTCWAIEKLRGAAAIVLACWAVIVVALMAATTTYLPVWSTTERLAANSAEHAPRSERAWSALATALRDAGYGIDQILPPVQKAIEADPTASRPWSILAISLRDAGHAWDRIEPPMLKALQLDPDDTVALNLHAIHLIETGRLAEADKLVPRIEPKALHDQSVLNTIGMLRFEQENYDEAVSWFERAVSFNRSSPGFTYNLALSYEVSGRCHDALATWRAYLELESRQERVAIVQDRIAKNFYSEGGRCFGADQASTHPAGQ